MYLTERSRFKSPGQIGNPSSSTSPNANMARKRRSTCDHCRQKHIKCEPGQPLSASCRQCHKDQVPCTQTKTRIRFSDVSAKISKRNRGSDHDSKFIARTNTPRKLVYVDETAELAALYNEDDDSSEGLISTAPPIGESKDNPVFDLPPTVPAKNSREVIPTPSTVARIDLLLGDSVEDTFRLSADPCISQPASQHTTSENRVLRDLVKPPGCAILPTSTLEFGLLRYYIDHLSMWLDLCDPERHFQLAVPHRARSCPPLMNAILAASARHLTRVPKYRTSSGQVEYEGRVLHDLTDETALHYHNKCIHDLLALSTDPQQLRNEDLLAAAIILRFYEEVDYPLQDEQKDDELFLRVLNMFIEAQIPRVPLISQRTPSIASITGTAPEAFDPNHGSDPASSPIETYTSPSSSTLANIMTLESRWYMSSLRQAAFWVAFRQEVYSAFIKQRPFNMSLSRCDVFRSFTPGEDALWTARLVIFCADVLEFCYGGTEHTPDQTISSKEKWTHLKSQSEKWVESLPSSFEPIYSREANRQSGEVFPEICYLTNIHVAGVQHIELARILLAVYNPHIPRLGFGCKESMRLLSEELKASVLRLCGIAVHNRKNPPSLTTALLGIVVCGEHFDDRAEQRALLNLLDELEWHHGWPVENYRKRLKQSWCLS